MPDENTQLHAAANCAACSLVAVAVDRGAGAAGAAAAGRAARGRLEALEEHHWEEDAHLRLELTPAQEYSVCDQG